MELEVGTVMVNMFSDFKITNKTNRNYFVEETNHGSNTTNKEWCTKETVHEWIEIHYVNLITNVWTDLIVRMGNA